jgi:hypothetical protein
MKKISFLILSAALSAGCVPQHALQGDMVQSLLQEAVFDPRFQGHQGFGQGLMGQQQGYLNQIRAHRGQQQWGGQLQHGQRRGMHRQHNRGMNRGMHQGMQGGMPNQPQRGQGHRMQGGGRHHSYAQGTGAHHHPQNQRLTALSGYPTVSAPNGR